MSTRPFVRMSDRALRLCGVLGIVSLASYTAAVVFAPLAYPGYDWMSQAVSDLSAMGAPSRELWNRLAFFHAPCGLACATATAIYVARNRAWSPLFRTGIYLFALMNWLSAVGYQLFPLAEAGKEITGFSSFMHVYVVTTGVVLSSIASLACIAAASARSKGPKPLAVAAGIALALMFVGAVGTAVVPTRYFGVVERCSVFAAVGFNAILGLSLARGKLAQHSAVT